MLYEILKSLSLFVLRCFFKLDIKGKQSLPSRGPFILAANHVSNLDPIVIGAACSRQLYYLAKEELFKSKLFGLLLKNINAIPLKRARADLSTMRTAIKVLEKEPLLLFPQGTRGARIDNVKAGVGFLYKKTTVPIIAAKIYGTESILPKGARFLKKGKIRVVFSKVATLRETDSNEDVALKVMETIKSL
jgi:1-acyl-sn-glycerol-3-phosphate acyltransferase